VHVIRASQTVTSEKQRSGRSHAHDDSVYKWAVHCDARRGNIETSSELFAISQTRLLLRTHLVAVAASETSRDPTKLPKHVRVSSAHPRIRADIRAGIQAARVQP